MASTTDTSKINLRMDADELDLLDDALAYFAMSDMGGGDRDTQEDRDTMLRLLMRVNSARDRLANVGTARCDEVTMDQRCLLRTGHPGGHVSSEWGI